MNEWIEVIPVIAAAAGIGILIWKGGMLAQRVSNNEEHISKIFEKIDRIDRYVVRNGGSK